MINFRGVVYEGYNKVYGPSNSWRKVDKFTESLNSEYRILATVDGYVVLYND